MIAMDQQDAQAPRAALYIRVSTDRQAEKYGLSAQEQELKKRLAERGYVLVRDGDAEAFADDGYSGGDLRRPALSRLREGAQQHLFDVLLVFDPDRLSRSLKDQLLLTDEFETQGVQLEFLTQEMDASPEGKLFFAIRGAVAEFEKEKIRERTMRGKREKARRGMVVNPGNLPAWLGTESESGEVVLVGKWAEVLRLIFHLYVDEGWTLRHVARHLTSLGYPTPSGGHQWQPSVVHHWLRNPAAKGEYFQLRMDPAEPSAPRKPALGRVRPSARNGKRLRPQEEWFVVKVPAVVDAKTWDAVQKRLDANKVFAKRNARRFYLLRGLVVCGACGYRMAGIATQRQKRRYRCGRMGALGRADGGGTCPENLSVDAEWLEDLVWVRVTNILRNPELLRQELHRRQEAGSPTRTGIDEELGRVRTRIGEVGTEMDRLIEGYGKGFIPDDLMADRMTALRQEREQLRVRLEELERDVERLETQEHEAASVLAFAERVSEGLETLGEEERHMFLRTLVKEIVVYRNRVVIQTILPIDDPGGAGEKGDIYIDQLRTIHSRPSGAQCPQNLSEGGFYAKTRTSSLTLYRHFCYH